MEKPLINNINEINSNQYSVKSFDNLKPKSATVNLKTPIAYDERRPKTTNTASSEFHREKTLSKITLSIGEQNKPDLLERYWKYNRIKRHDVLKNRFSDEAELNSIYLTCSKYYMGNFRQLIRVKSNLNKNSDQNKNQSREQNSLSREATLKSRTTLPTVSASQFYADKETFEKSQILSSRNQENRAKTELKKFDSQRKSTKAISNKQDFEESNQNFEKRRFMLSISDFNKFKNRFKDNLSSKRKSIEDLTAIENENSYTVNEIKRLRYIHAIQQRQILLSQSINVKKLEI